MCLIVGISGKAGHGKDTIADHLVENHGFKKMAFAEPLKEVCRTIFGFTDRQLYGDQKERLDTRWGTTPRKCLQFIGTELFRNQIHEILPGIGEDIWTHCLCRRIESHFEKNPRVPIVISDVRFENEWRLVKSLPYKSLCIRVTNPRVEDLSSPRSQHSSERLDLWKADRSVINNGSHEDLYVEVDEILFN